MINAAVVGLGWAGSKHLSIYQRIPDVEVIGIADFDFGRAKSLAEKYFIPGVYDNYQEMLEKEDIELLSICTTTSTHLDVVLNSVDHIKYLLIEKPMALTVNQCQTIIDVCNEKDVEICVCHNRLYYPDIIQAKEFLMSIDSNKMFVKVDFHIPGIDSDDWKAKQSEGGMLWEEGSHTAYIIQHFLDDITEVEAVGKITKYSVYDSIRAFIKSSGDKLGVLDISWTKKRNLSLQLITLDEDCIEINLDYRDPITISDYSAISFLRQASRIVPKTIMDLLLTKMKIKKNPDPNSHHFDLISSFIKSIQDPSKPIPVTGHDGKKAVHLLEVIEKSIYTKKPISIIDK